MPVYDFHITHYKSSVEILVVIEHEFLWKNNYMYISYIEKAGRYVLKLKTKFHYKLEHENIIIH